MITSTKMRRGALCALGMLTLACPGCLGGQSGEPVSGSCEDGPTRSRTESLRNLPPVGFLVVEGSDLVGDSMLELRFEVAFDNFELCRVTTETSVNVHGMAGDSLGQLQGVLSYDEEEDTITVQVSAAVEGWLAPGLSDSVQQAIVFVQLDAKFPAPDRQEAATYSLALNHLIKGEAHESTWKAQNETNP